MPRAGRRCLNVVLDKNWKRPSWLCSPLLLASFFMDIHFLYQTVLDATFCLNILHTSFWVKFIWHEWLHKWALPSSYFDHSKTQNPNPSSQWKKWGRFSSLNQCFLPVLLFSIKYWMDNRSVNPDAACQLAHRWHLRRLVEQVLGNWCKLKHLTCYLWIVRKEMKRKLLALGAWGKNRSRGLTHRGQNLWRETVHSAHLFVGPRDYSCLLGKF